MSRAGFDSVMNASTSGGGCLRIRRGPGGRVVLTDPFSAILGAAFGVPAAVIGLGAVAILVLPPWDTSLMGVLILLFTALALGTVAAIGGWAFALGRSRLEIAPDDRRLAAFGPRWTIPSDRPVHVHAVRLVRGPLVRHGNSGRRRTWLVRLACGDEPPASGDPGPSEPDAPRPPTLDVLQAWKLPAVRSRATELAEVLDVPLDDRAPERWDPADRND